VRRKIQAVLRGASASPPTQLRNANRVGGTSTIAKTT
jgi:hypothetical protein